MHIQRKKRKYKKCSIKKTRVEIYSPNCVFLFIVLEYTIELEKLRKKLQVEKNSVNKKKKSQN